MDKQPRRTSLNNPRGNYRKITVQGLLFLTVEQSDPLPQILGETQQHAFPIAIHRNLHGKCHPHTGSFLKRAKPPFGEWSMNRARDFMHTLQAIVIEPVLLQPIE